MHDSLFQSYWKQVAQHVTCSGKRKQQFREEAYQSVREYFSNCADEGASVESFWGAPDETGRDADGYAGSSGGRKSAPTEPLAAADHCGCGCALLGRALFRGLSVNASAVGNGEGNNHNLPGTENFRRRFAVADTVRRYMDDKRTARRTAKSQRQNGVLG